MTGDLHCRKPLCCGRVYCNCHCAGCDEERLDAYEHLMVKWNLEYVQAEGLEAVVARLHRHGYHGVATAVQRAAMAE